MTLYAHQMTFPKMLASKEPVINQAGIMIGGPDRKSIDEWSRWVLWQKAVVKAGEVPDVVPPEVMVFFQKTKGFTHPPRTEDLNHVEDAVIVKKELLVVPKSFRLTWSWTALSLFLRCPCCWAAKYFYKTMVEPETEAMRWGNVVHKALENAADGKATAVELKIIDDLGAEKYVQALSQARASGAQVLVEKEMCFDNKMKFSSWKAFDTVWVRAKADVIVFKGNKLTVWDYKTGAVKPEVRQLELMCAFAALYFPQAEVFDGKLIFLKHNKIEGLPTPLTRADLKPILQSVFADVRHMQEAVAAESFPARKSGLCRPNGKGYMGCANKGCPHAN